MTPAGKPLTSYFAIDEADWLERTAERENCSKSYLVRRGVWLLRCEYAEKARASAQESEKVSHTSS